MSVWIESRQRRARGCGTAHYDNGPQAETGMLVACRQIAETSSAFLVPVTKQSTVHCNRLCKGLLTALHAAQNFSLL